MVKPMSDRTTTLVPAGMEESGPRYGMSPGVRSGELIFVSGQLGIDEDGSVPDDGPRQAELAFEALARVLAEAGAGLEDIIQLQTVHVGDVTEALEWFLPIKSRYIRAPYPSWTGFGVASLAGDGTVLEIGAIARVPT
jgi:enamine deaminase RidA (YjgF/YER057c/UK114 family)